MDGQMVVFSPLLHATTDLHTTHRTFYEHGHGLDSIKLFMFSLAGMDIRWTWLVTDTTILGFTPHSTSLEHFHLYFRLLFLWHGVGRKRISRRKGLVAGSGLIWWRLALSIRRGFAGLWNGKMVHGLVWFSGMDRRSFVHSIAGLMDGIALIEPRQVRC